MSAGITEIADIAGQDAEAEKVPDLSADFLYLIEVMLRWKCPAGQKGREVRSERQLKKIYPTPDGCAEIFKNKVEKTGVLPGFNRYSWQLVASGKIRSYDIAYKCISCRKIFVGPPEIQLVRTGLEYSCIGCQKKMAVIK